MKLNLKHVIISFFLVLLCLFYIQSVYDNVQIQHEVNINDYSQNISDSSITPIYNDFDIASTADFPELESLCLEICDENITMDFIGLKLLVSYFIDLHNNLSLTDSTSMQSSFHSTNTYLQEVYIEQMNVEFLMSINQITVYYENQLHQRMINSTMIKHYKEKENDIIYYNACLITLQKVHYICKHSIIIIQNILHRYHHSDKISAKLNMINKYLKIGTNLINEILQRIYSVDKHGFNSKYIYTKDDFASIITNITRLHDCNENVVSYANHSNICNTMFENTFVKIIVNILLLKTNRKYKNMSFYNALGMLIEKKNYTITSKITKFNIFLKDAFDSYSSQSQNKILFKSIVKRLLDLFSENYNKKLYNENTIENLINMRNYSFIKRYRLEVIYVPTKNQLGFETAMEFIQEFNFNTILFDNTPKTSY